MCDYYDDVEALQGFGAANAESLAELVWAFFEYWAWKHDYNNAVVSVRTGGFLTKSQKEWTRRVGNERHLVCIEVHAPAAEPERGTTLSLSFAGCLSLAARAHCTRLGPCHLSRRCSGCRDLIGRKAVHLQALACTVVRCAELVCFGQQPRL